MFFEITKHLFNPGSASVESQGHSFVGQIGGQAPGLLFAALPMNQQVDLVDMVDGQIACSKPNALPGFFDVTTESLPTLLFGKSDTGIRLLS